MDENFVFMDIEASGLHRTSFPIEVGWAGANLKVQSFLINPHITWEPRDWSYESERIHGLTQADLDIKGIGVREAAERLNDAWKDKAIFSDAPAMDGFWLRRLYEAARVVPTFSLRLLDGMALIKGALRDRGLPTDMGTLEEYERSVDVRYPRPHRAGPDALHLAALYRACKGDAL